MCKDVFCFITPKVILLIEHNGLFSMENSEILGLPELATETTLLAVHMKNASYTYPSRAFRG